MRVVVTGASGLIGSAVVEALRRRGDEVVRLVRRPTSAPDEVRWDPAGGGLDASALGHVDGAVHLAGAGVGDKRWTEARKQEILQSRELGTSLLATALAKLDPLPAVLVSGSAIGYYGNRGDDELDEGSRSGEDFLSQVVRRWEAATNPASAAGVRVAHIRTGLVLSADGGFLGRQLLPFKLGLGGPLGPGKQWQSWIAIDDHVAAVLHILDSPAASGPVNLTAPNPVTSKEMARTLGKVLRRPAVVPIPPFALGLLLGPQLVEEAFMASQKVLPVRLQAEGFTFRYPELEPALRHVLGKDAA